MTARTIVVALLRIRPCRRHRREPWPTFYLVDLPGHARREQIDRRHPGLIDGLARHPQIGAVMVRAGVHGALLVAGIALVLLLGADEHTLDPAERPQDRGGAGRALRCPGASGASLRATTWRAPIRIRRPTSPT